MHSAFSRLVLASRRGLLALLLVASAACSDDKPATSSSSAGAVATPADATLLSDVPVAEDSEDVDLGGDDLVSVDLGPAASDTVDAADTGGSSCPGGPNCPCDKNEVCDSGLCLEAQAGKLCAVPCSTDGGCPAGSTCKSYGGADTTFVCVSNFVTLCAPCQTAADCLFSGTQALCLDYGAEGKFCGGACAADLDCPDGYACATVADPATGKDVGQCKHKSDTAGITTCGCGGWAAASGHKTSCSVTNSFGTCQGTRGCSATGLAPCDAKIAIVETCNGLDDDCDSKIDNLPADATCTVKAFATGGSGAVCKTDGDCGATAGEACDGGVCKPLIGACPGSPTCSSAGVLLCVNAQIPKAEQCDGGDNDCDGQTDEGFSALGADGSVTAVGMACGVGACGGGLVECATLGTAACTTALKAKSEQCNGNDDDCNGATDDLACEDNDACTTDTCDVGASKCGHAMLDCDDAQQCTIDSCNAKTGLCAHGPYSGSCSDGDSCTAGDLCQIADDATPACAPGKAVDCNDANPCTDDACNPLTGCVNLPNAATQACYGGAPGTQGVGACLGGTELCVNGKFQTCVGQIVPNPVEQCDGSDDDCDGTVDEGCKSGTIQADFASAGGAAGGAWLELATGAPSGTSSAVGGKTGWWGLVFWFPTVFQ